MARPFHDIGLNLGGMTTVQRDAMYGEKVGTIIYNYDSEVWQYYNGVTWDNIGATDYDPTLKIQFFEDFVNGIPASIAGGNFFATNNTTGTNTVLTPTIDTRLGVIAMSTTTGATNRAIVASNSTLTLGGGTSTLEGSFKLPLISDGTESFWVRFGFSNNPTLQNPTTNIGIVYAHGTSPNWRCTTSIASVATTTVTTVAATAATEYNFKIIVTPLEVTFFINGVLVATHTTNIPADNATYLSAYLAITKFLGTTARTLELDWLRFTKILDTPRK